MNNKLTAIKDSAVFFANKVGFKAKKYSPEMLLGLGIAGFVTTVVLACRATKKAAPIEEGFRDSIDELRSQEFSQGVAVPGLASREERRAIAKVELQIYAHYGMKYVKLYAPAAVVGLVSVASVLASHGIMCKRNAALAATVATLEQTISEYRQRLVDKFGEEAEKDIRYNRKSEEVEVTEKGEDGTERVVKKKLDYLQPSQFAVLFDELNPYYEKGPDYNCTFLRAREAQLNDMLRSRGYVFLNEAYDMIGAPRTKAGQIMGWKYDPSNPDLQNYITFGIFETANKRAEAFRRGIEWSVLVDFNVDGNIWSMM